MSFTDAVQTGFRKYVVFSGKASRSEYWWFFVFLLLANTACGAIDSVIFGNDLIEEHVIDAQTYATIKTTGPVQSTFWLLTVLPFLAASWRRMHDAGRSGLFLFLPVIIVLAFGFGAASFGVMPDDVGWSGHVGVAALIVTAGLLSLLISVILLLWWLTRPSQCTTNDYGPDPNEVTP